MTGGFILLGVAAFLKKNLAETFTTVLSWTGVSYSSSWQGYTGRFIIKKENFSTKTANKIKITFTPHSNRKIRITKCYIGSASGSTYNFLSAPVKVKFKGNDSYAGLVNGESVTSDSTSINYNGNANNLLITFFISSGDPVDLVNSSDNYMECRYIERDEASLLSVGNYNKASTNSIGITKIEFA